MFVKVCATPKPTVSVVPVSFTGSWEELVAVLVLDELLTGAGSLDFELDTGAGSEDLELDVGAGSLDFETIASELFVSEEITSLR